MASRIFDLGFGVQVEIDPDPELPLVVTSRRLVLPIKPRGGRLPGSAVLWNERLYEVEAAHENRFTLRPWPESEVARTIFQLDGQHLPQLAEFQGFLMRGRQVYPWLVGLFPFSALAPAKIQHRWHLEYGFPDRKATILSALLIAGIGFPGWLEQISWCFGYGFLPPGYAWLKRIGPWMVLDSFFRWGVVFAEHRGAGPVLVELGWWVWGSFRRNHHVLKREI